MRVARYSGTIVRNVHESDLGTIPAYSCELTGPYREQFARIPSLILKTIRDSKFPKRRNAQINFLADSLAAWGAVSPRRSRDICGNERAKERAKSPHRIIRKEFYVECSCGYKGPARDNACRKCGATIPMELETMWGDFRSFRKLSVSPPSLVT